MSSTILNSYGKSRWFLILVVLLWNYVCLNGCWQQACCKLPLLCLGMSPVSPISPGLLCWKEVGFSPRSFLHLMKWSCIFFFSLSLFIWQVTFTDFHVRDSSIPKLQRWSLLNHGRWCFWRVIYFSLWVLMHLCSEMILVCNSFLCWAIMWFGYLWTYKWIGQHSFCFYFVESYEEY